MLANFKWKQNTGGFAQNPQNINKQGRPIDDLKFLLEDAIASGDLTLGLSDAIRYAMKKRKLTLREILMIQNTAFARWYYLTGGDMKKYYKVFGIR
jgi:hypothetical protein